MKTIPLLISLLAGLLLVSCAPVPVRVACIGDSITEGTGLHWESKSAYPALLDSLLGPGYAVLNCGRSGATLLKNGNFPFWTRKDFSNVFSFQPDIVVIKLGTNDTKPFNWNASEFEKDYQALIDTLRTIPAGPQIHLCLPVPVFQTRWGINDSTMTAGVIPIIRKIADANRLPVIDLYTPLIDYPQFFPDAIHPDEAGALRMAGLVARALLEN